jgi:hypothetical protein
MVARMKMHRAAIWLLLGTLLGLPLASAELAHAWDDPGAWDGTTGWGTETSPFSPRGEVTNPYTPPLRPPGRMFGSFDLGVPVVLDVDRSLIRPGANLHAQGGLDLGYVALFLHGGWRWIPVDFDRASDDHPEYAGEGRDPLKNPYFGFGVRVQVPNRSRVIPYLSASVDFNWWNFRESDVACGGGYYYWYCNDYNVYKFTPGFSGRLGSLVHVRHGVYADFGLGVSMSLEGDFFDRNEVWFEPFIGIAYRR